MLYQFNDSKKVLDTGQAVGRLLAETENRDFVHLTIQPDGGIAAHSMPVSVAFFVVAGEGEIDIDGETLRLNAGDMIDVEQGKNRSWHNAGEDELKLLVVKSK